MGPVIRVLLAIGCVAILVFPALGQRADKPFFFDPGSGATDWSESSLAPEIHDSVRVIGLGEFSHGAREVFEVKTDIISYLVANEGVDMILFEFPDIVFRYINNYLLDDKVYSDEVARSLILMNLNSSYRAEEIVGLCMLLKKHNLSTGSKVQLRGIDISPTIHPPIEYIIHTYVGPTNRDAANSFLALKGKIPDTALLRQLSSYIKKGTIEEHGAKNENDQLNFAYDLKNASESYAMQTANWSPLMRDSSMAENVKLLAEGHKTVIWAHNHHLMKSISVRGENRNLGSFLDMYYRNAYFMIATDFFGFADVIVRGKESGTSKSTYTPSRFESKRQSFVSDYVRDNKVLGSFLLSKNDFRDSTSDVNLNCIDAVGTHYLLSQKKNEKLPFDALIVLKGASPARMIK